MFSFVNGTTRHDHDDGDDADNWSIEKKPMVLFEASSFFDAAAAMPPCHIFCFYFDVF